MCVVVFVPQGARDICIVFGWRGCTHPHERKVKRFCAGKAEVRQCRQGQIEGNHSGESQEVTGTVKVGEPGDVQQRIRDTYPKNLKHPSIRQNDGGPSDQDTQLKATYCQIDINYLTLVAMGQQEALRSNEARRRPRRCIKGLAAEGTEPKNNRLPRGGISPSYIHYNLQR